jgi:hypothetical protein
MKLRSCLLMLAVVSSAWATEHTDPLSQVRYDIPQDTRTQEKTATQDGSRVYMLAYLMPDQKASVVFATSLKEGRLAGSSDEALLTKIKNGMIPRCKFTKEEFRNISGRRYQVSELYEAGGSSNSYFTMYTVIQSSYVFTICFTTSYDQGSMQETWNSIVAKVVYP